MFRPVSLLLGVVVWMVLQPAQARLVKLEVESREIVAGGASFGDAGAYEKLTGRAYFEAAPGEPRNAQVFDIDRAPVNVRGKVEFSARMMILKPVDLARGNGGLFFEVNNRGRKIAFMRLHDSSIQANLNNPSAASDFGNGFLMRQGFSIAWVGWGADIAEGDSRLTVDFPIAMENGEPISERIVTEFSDRNFNGVSPTSLPLSGGNAFKSFAAVSHRKKEAEAELRERPSDSPTAGGAEIPPGELIAPEEWGFAACPDGAPGTPSRSDICLAGGFLNNSVYELTYRAAASPVMGLGYLTSRDFVSFLRYAESDDAGIPNPLAGINRALCLGISSSGMYMRDFLYQGFNEDESGRRVCDGAYVHVAGAQKLYLNYRFAQPNPFTQQHRERYVPDTNFPRAYAIRPNPLDGPPDGILKRPATDPKLIHSDTANEYYQFRASLLGTDDDGREDRPESPNVRRYLFASLQHGGFKDDPGGYGIANRQCQNRTNPLHPGVFMRALVVALDNWVKHGTAPPPSRIPQIADGSLVAPAKVEFPQILGVAYRGIVNESAERDFGPRVAANRGVVDVLLPRVIRPHKVLVPQVDTLGNDLGGIRHPMLQVPLATYAGWNLRRPEFRGDDLCDLLGSMIPLERSKADREWKGDPRPALRELYRDRGDYLARVEAAAMALRDQGLMLDEDVARIITEASAVTAFDD